MEAKQPKQRGPLVTMLQRAVDWFMRRAQHDRSVSAKDFAKVCRRYREIFGEDYTSRRER